jgi:predicted dehydrogenase
MTDELAIGVIGAGSVFRRRHLPGLRELEDVRVAAVANRSTESGREVVDEFDLDADVTTDPVALVAREDVDAVMIGTWPYRHCPYAIEALDAGKHTFVQARMARNLAEAREMYARAAETDLVAQICPSPLGMRGDPYVRELLADGYVGDVYEVHGSVRSGNRADPTAPLHWREIERYQGVNALAVGILIEVLHRWVGHASTVSARAATHVRERPLPDGEGTGPVERPTTVGVNCRLENGATGSFSFSSVSRHAPGNRIGIYGSDGTLVYDLENDVVRGGKPEDEGLSELPIPDGMENDWTVERDFVEAIRSGGRPRTTFHEGVKYMEFTEAVFRSVETGGEVHLPLVT